MPKDEHAPARPLAGVRVLDLSSPIGPYCGRLLADLGASVTLVEPPAGDPYRGLGPYRDDAAEHVAFGIDAVVAGLRSMLDACLASDEPP